ncbi:MAG TPA: MFS transporter [Mycobacteriales bacterium]|nr:MFS transporter [Mycobacteriales bacterium]
MTTSQPPRLRDSLVDHLSDGCERHGQRWRLRLSPADEPERANLRLLIVLGLPTLGLSFAVTMLTTYGPVVLLDVTKSPAKVGALIGGEGAFALLIPLVAGMLSDRISSARWGRRLPFVAVGAPLVMAGLALLPFVSSYRLAGFAVLLFFIGYYLYYPPYRALYADLLPRRLYARAQSSQAVLRGVGLGAALIAGGVLLSAWTPLPFVIAAAVLLATTFALGPVLRWQTHSTRDQLDYAPSSVGDLLRNRPMLIFAGANALWELSFSGLKTFIVLFVVQGLGRSPGMASLVIAMVAVAYVVGAPIASRLAERFGIARVMTWAAACYGVGLCIGTLLHSLGPGLVLLPFVALAGAVLLTLPQALAFLLAPTGGQGAAAGLLDVSRGVGVVLGPLLVGAAVTASSAHNVFSSTKGYAAMWPVIGLAVLATLPLLRMVRPQVESVDDDALRVATAAV